MDEDKQLKVWVLLWRWWSARNKVNAGEKQLPTQEIISLVTFYVSEFEKLRKKEIKKGQKGYKNGNLHNLDSIRLTLMQLFGPKQKLVDGVCS